MWKFLREFAPANPSRRRRPKPAPGPLAWLARDYAALEVVAWPAVRRRPHLAEIEAR